MKTGLKALRIFLFLSIVTGVIYPGMVTVLGRIRFHDDMEGSLVLRDGKVIGSKWIGQNFESDKYFWPRPSAVQYNPLPSGGTNLSPTSATLKVSVQERMTQFGSNPPTDLLFSSASGLDPHITPEAALFQINRVAAARHLPPDQVKALVLSHIEPATLRILGQPRINVLLLNMTLDEP